MAENIFPDLPVNEQEVLEPESYFTKDILNLSQNVQLPGTYIDYHLTEDEATVEVLQNVGNIFEQPQPDVEALPTAREQLSAAFELENPISNIVDYFSDPGSTTSRRGGEFYDENNNFDVKRWLTPEEAHLSRFMEDAETPDEAQAIYDKIQEEQVAKGILGSGPLNPFAASLPAVLADPSIFIPVVGGATKLGTIGRIAITGAGQALLTEAIIQQNQLTRTMTDSAINVVASGLFSGAAGAAAIGIRARYVKKAEATKRAEEEAAFRVRENEEATIRQAEAAKQAEVDAAAAREARAQEKARAEAVAKAQEEQAVEAARVEEQATQTIREEFDTTVRQDRVSEAVGEGQAQRAQAEETTRTQAEQAQQTEAESAADLAEAFEDTTLSQAARNYEAVREEFNLPAYNDVQAYLPDEVRAVFANSTPEELRRILSQPAQEGEDAFGVITRDSKERKAALEENLKETQENVARMERGEEPIPTKAEQAEQELVEELTEKVNNEQSSILRGKDPVEENTRPIERSLDSIIDDDYYKAGIPEEPGRLIEGLDTSPYQRLETAAEGTSFKIKTGDARKGDVVVNGAILLKTLGNESRSLMGDFVPFDEGLAVGRRILANGADNFRRSDLSDRDIQIIEEALEGSTFSKDIRSQTVIRAQNERLERWARDVEKLNQAFNKFELRDTPDFNLSDLPSRTAAILDASRIINNANTIRVDPSIQGGQMLPNGDIYIGKESRDFLKNLMHEVGHNLIYRGVLSDSEVAYLRQAAKDNGWLETFKVNNRWSDLYKDRPDKQALFEEEAIVEAFANWVADPRPVADSKVQQIFQKLREYLTSFIDMLNEGVLGNTHKGKAPKDFVIDEESERLFSEAYYGERTVRDYPEGIRTADDIVANVRNDPSRLDRLYPTDADLDYEHFIKYRPPEEAAPQPVSVARSAQGKVAEETTPEVPEYEPSLDPADTRLWRGRLGIGEHINRGFSAFKGSVGFLSSSQRAIGSPFPTVREFNFRLNNVENLPLAGFAKGKTLGGKSDVEGRIQQATNQWQTKQLIDKKKVYSSYRERVKAEGGKPLDKTKFDYEVGRAFRTGQSSSIPEVNQSVRDTEALIGEINKRMVDVGLEVKPDYKPISWNTRAIDENQNKVLEIIEKNVPGIESRAQAAKVLQKSLRENNGTRTAEPYRVKTEEGEYDLNIEELDEFFEDDINHVIYTYLRTALPDIELKGMFGTTNPNKLIERYVLEDLNKAIELNPNQSGKLVRRARDDIRNLQNQVDEMRGLNALGYNSPYAGLARIERGLRQYAFSNLLGGVAVSSLPELSRLVTTAGFKRAFGSYIGTFGKGLQTLKATKDEAVKQGAVADMITAQHVKINLGDDNLTPGTTKAEKILEWNARKMGVFTGLTHLTDGQKIAASAEINDFILRSALRVEQGEKLADIVNQRDLIRLARIGIDEETLRKIAKEKNNFQNNNGKLLAGIETWEDAELAMVMKNAVVKEVSSTVITPRPSNRPAWANKAVLGRSLYFLKSFFMASDSHIVQANLTYADGRTLTGATMALGLGMIVTAMKDLAAHGEVKERSVGEWIVNGIDRSGLTGSLFLSDTIQASVTGHSLQALASGGRVSSRYQDRGFEAALGPIVHGIPDKIMSLGSSIWDGYQTKQDYVRLKRTLPWQNHPAFNYILNKVVDSYAERYNLPENYREAIRQESQEGG